MAWDLLKPELLAAQDGLCGLCRLPLQLSAANIDHITPLAHGGSNEPWNLQATHRECNWWKSDIEHAVMHCLKCKDRVAGVSGLALHWDKRHGPKAGVPRHKKKESPSDLRRRASRRYFVRRAPEHPPLDIKAGQIVYAPVEYLRTGVS